MKLITLQTFESPIDAHLLKSTLESEGITCVIFDENVVGLNPLYNVAVGGIKLKVVETDITKAIEILEATTNTALTNDKGEVITCPNCQSEKIYTGIKSMKGLCGVIYLFISFVIALFPVSSKTIYRCKVCTTEFKEH